MVNKKILYKSVYSTGFTYFMFNKYGYIITNEYRTVIRKQSFSSNNVMCNNNNKDDDLDKDKDTEYVADDLDNNTLALELDRERFSKSFVLGRNMGGRRFRGITYSILKFRNNYKHIRVFFDHNMNVIRGSDFRAFCEEIFPIKSRFIIEYTIVLSSIDRYKKKHIRTTTDSFLLEYGHHGLVLNLINTNRFFTFLKANYNEFLAQYKEGNWSLNYVEFHSYLFKRGDIDKDSGKHSSKRVEVFSVPVHEEDIIGSYGFNFTDNFLKFDFSKNALPIKDVFLFYREGSSRRLTNEDLRHELYDSIVECNNFKILPNVSYSKENLDKYFSEFLTLKDNFENLIFVHSGAHIIPKKDISFRSVDNVLIDSSTRYFTRHPNNVSLLFDGVPNVIGNEAPKELTIWNLMEIGDLDQEDIYKQRVKDFKLHVNLEEFPHINSLFTDDDARKDPQIYLANYEQFIKEYNYLKDQRFYFPIPKLGDILYIVNELIPEVKYEVYVFEVIDNVYYFNRKFIDHKLFIYDSQYISLVPEFLTLKYHFADRSSFQGIELDVEFGNVYTFVGYIQQGDLSFIRYDSLFDDEFIYIEGKPYKTKYEFNFLSLKKIFLDKSNYKTNDGLSDYVTDFYNSDGTDNSNSNFDVDGYLADLKPFYLENVSTKDIKGNSNTDIIDLSNSSIVGGKFGIFDFLTITLESDADKDTDSLILEPRYNDSTKKGAKMLDKAVNTIVDNERVDEFLYKDSINLDKYINNSFEVDPTGMSDTKPPKNSNRPDFYLKALETTRVVAIKGFINESSNFKVNYDKFYFNLCDKDYLLSLDSKFAGVYKDPDIFSNIYQELDIFDCLIIDFIDSLLIDKYNNYVFYGHKFSSLYGHFIIKTLFSINEHFRTEVNYLKLVYGLNIIIREGSIYKLSIKKKVGTKVIKITLLDSSLLFSYPIQELAHSLGDDKYSSNLVFPYKFISKDTIVSEYSGSVPGYKYFESFFSHDEYLKYRRNLKDREFNSLFYDPKKTKKLIWDLKVEMDIYLENVCYILFKFIFIFRFFILSNYKVDVFDTMTISRLALTIFGSQFLKNDNFPLIYNKREFNFFSEGYFGGLTEVYRPYGENLYYYDVNSLYPYVSLDHNPFPGLDCTYNYFKRGEYTHENISELFGFFLCEVDTSNVKEDYLGLLAHRNDDGSVIYPLGKYLGIWTSEELKLASENGYIINVIKGYQFNKVYGYFDEFIYHFYDRKNKSIDINTNIKTKLKSVDLKSETQAQNKGIYRNIYKSLLNNLLGRFGLDFAKARTSYLDRNGLYNLVTSNYHISSIFLVPGNMYLVNYYLLDSLSDYIGNLYFKDTIFQDDASILAFFDNLNKQNIDIGKLDASEYDYSTDFDDTNLIESSVIISAFVTSYARVFMHKIKLALLKNKVKIYYSDTDSLVVDKPIEDFLPDVVGPNIGQFKFVHHVKRGYFISDKLYCLIIEKKKSKINIYEDVHIIAKGISFTEGLNEESFKSLLKNSKVSEPTYDDINLTTETQVQGVKQSIIRNYYEGFASIILQNINIYPDSYNKRIKIYNNDDLWIDTKPITVIDNRLKTRKKKR